jgi:hypothetical protein
VSRAIGCDLDGVVFNFAQGFSTLANSLYPDAPIITDNQCPSWDWKDWYMGGGARAEEVVEGTWREIEHAGRYFWSDLPVLFPNDMNYLRDIYREWPTVFMTRRDWNYAYDQSYLSLSTQGISEPLVIRVHSGEEKWEWAKKLGIHVVIEDSPKNALGLLENGISVVLMRWPYNDEFYQKYRRRYQTTHPVLIGAESLKHALVRAQYLDALPLNIGVVA